jgi:eukaryotic-like serine/threonine-protein kinase
MVADLIGPFADPERFVLVRRLGGGSMGVVYEAFDRVLEDLVALKTLVPGDCRFLPNLQRELRLTRHVRHPNLVAIGGLYQCVETWALAMELLEGVGYLLWVWGTLTASCGASSNVNEPDDDVTWTTPSASEFSADARSPAPGPVIERLQHTLPQLGRALLALHAQGLIHCDVKPSNLLITPEGRLVLFDFGLVRAADERPRERTWAGTPAYMAPEQAGDGAVTAAADCYAVGVMMYQAITGRLPFVGTFQDVMHHKRSWLPAAPSLFAPGVPRELETLCMRLLSPDPKLRPTAAELAVWPR